jgi:2-methylcitrate dehydratase PrpD
MNLLPWAEMLSGALAPRDIVQLHLTDTIAAIATGLKTREGKALAELYNSRSDPAALAAAVSAIARLSECDDIHLESCVTPGAAVIPVALALAKGHEEFQRAVASGYAAGVSLGMAIGGMKALASGVWPTLLAAPLMAAVAASYARGHDTHQLAHAMALALAGANGIPGRPLGAPSGRWFLFAESVARGISASDAAGHDFQGDLTLLSQPWLAAQGGHDAIEMTAFTKIPSISEVGFKPFPIARQGANAVAAFQRILSEGIDPERIDTVEVFVPPVNVALLTRSLSDEDRLSRICNMGFQLACAALAPDALYDAERVATPMLTAFAARVSIAGDRNLESHWPGHWPARVVVKAGKEIFEGIAIQNEFDSGAPNLAESLHGKWRRLLPEESDPAPGNRAELWQQIAARVTMAARREG